MVGFARRLSAHFARISMLFGIFFGKWRRKIHKRLELLFW